ncbi:MAG: bifunctional homocysteine S-methyltransferase/methylenetetrahydrofolate reductase [Chloroflexi bacterium]|nr:bifunctional homocysteine S-methyltransferase/methylenetetrahydrofolate reductase [Chloroflexota bacterium]
MAKSKFLSLVDNSDSPLLGDGAMGTVLHNRGIEIDQCFDALNLTNPALVAEIHRMYIEAGAQVIQTNTFGANRFKLAEHGLDDKVTEINIAGVELARRVVSAAFKEVCIAGDVGPLGVRLAPFGRVQLTQARKAFSEQISALIDGGVDLFILETMTDLFEVREAILAARELSDLPILASMTFTRDDRTLLGDNPEKVAQTIFEAGADLIGINCSSGPAQLLRILKLMRQAIPDGRFSVMPNAGWPEQIAGRIMYPAGPDYFGEYALAFRNAGASLIGGCCGTTPQHIHTMRQALDNTSAKDYSNGSSIREVHAPEPIASPERRSQLADKLEVGEFAVAVEMGPPRGLATQKLIAGASLLAEVGADVINVADSPMARMRMSPWAVCELIEKELPVETTLHFATRGRNLLRLQGDLLAAHAIGVRNVFVVMGDPTAIGDYPEAMDDYDLAPTGLVKLIKQGFNAGLDHSGSQIGQPTSFFVGAALNLLPPDPARESKLLNRKLVNGADFFLTQPVYEPQKAKAFLQEYTNAYDSMQKPILVGVLPLFGVRHADFLHNEVPGIVIPDKLRNRLEKAGDAAPSEGVRIAIELIEQIRPWAAGVYLMPAFSRYDLAAEIIEAVKSVNS